jgi:1,2-dihydroxy-3-keto-5-methylthiopentene dioxygenase
MTTLTLFANDSSTAISKISDCAEITRLLAEHQVMFRQCQPDQQSDSTQQDDVLSAWASTIDALNEKHNFQTLDVMGIDPEHPQKEVMRDKFLHEHRHHDFEMRLFVRGSGVFYIHSRNQVLAVYCTKGDLISVPANTTHWFDMGAEPKFTAVRFFTAAEGWVGHFTGNDIASRYPLMEAL